MATTVVPKQHVLAIISVALLAAGGIMIETAMNITFPKLTQVFHTSLNNIQWVTTAYLLAVTVTMTTSAYLTNRFGARRIWLTANLLFIGGTICAGFANSLAILLLGRVLEGIAAGLAMPLMFNLVLSLIPKPKIGVWMGIGAMVISLAPSFGPTYGGALIETLGWRAIFFTLLVIPIASLLLGWHNIAHVAKQNKHLSFDFIAFSLLAIALITGLLVVNQLETGRLNILFLILAIISVTAFIYKSQHSQKVFLNIRLFKSQTFTLLLIPVTFYMFANLGLSLLIPNYLQASAGTTSFLAGFALLPGTLFGAFLSPYFGSLYDKVGATKLIFLGNGIFTISLLGMALLTHRLGFILILISYIIFTIGRSMAFSTGMTAAVDQLPIAQQNDANAILQASQMFMGALGTTVAALFGSNRGGIAIGLNQFLWLLFAIALLLFLLFWLQKHLAETTK
ncbi:MFS transporter [Leuconostoc citreum]|uniref:MFS transporter n=1 Tax=Leuconostoc citreum TaxID=33964 RepID=UPI0002465E9E|nr:MFS transporter [Leuconostoc citreum]CCF26679.1 Multidrug resistance protein B, MF superfamily [Leuconostoc citreum LBAE C11]